MGVLWNLWLKLGLDDKCILGLFCFCFLFGSWENLVVVLYLENWMKDGVLNELCGWFDVLKLDFCAAFFGLLIMVKFSSCFLRKCGKKVEILYIVMKTDSLLKLRCWRFCLHGPIYLYIYLCNRKSFEILKKKLQSWIIRLIF